MDKCWLLIGEIDGNVGYGVDDNFYLLGIYNNESNARTAMKLFAESEDAFIVDGDNLFREPYTGGIISGEEFDRRYDKRPEPIKCSEFTYEVKQFTGTAIFIGGGYYIE